jgi:hypothetical protein
MDFLPDDKTMCHETAFEKSCRDMVKNCRCRKWMQIRGMNPNTGDPIDKWDCVDSLLPLLLIENSQMQRQTSASIESFRNEVVRTNDQTSRIIAAAAFPRNGKLVEIEDHS